MLLHLCSDTTYTFTPITMKTITKHVAYLLLVAITLSSCSNYERKSEGRKSPSILIKNRITADVQTKIMPQDKNEDSADDPAIWINPNDVERSIIFGTDKKGGIGAYNLQGEELAYYPIGNINNIDVRQNVLWGNDTIDIIAGTNRTTHSISVAEIMKDGTLSFFSQDTLKAQTKGEVYGFSFFYNGKNLYAFLNSKEGEVEQWELRATKNNGVTGEIVRSFDMEAQTEGMVADDENNTMYLGVERKGIYKFSACPNSSLQGHYILRSRPRRNIYIDADIEGLAIYKESDCRSYLIASSQGNYSYAVFNLRGNNDYLFSFTIEDGIKGSDFIDGVEETDGIEIFSNALGDQFPFGVLIVQDGYNRDKNDNLLAQNFKYIDWQKIDQFIK